LKKKTIITFDVESRYVVRGVNLCGIRNRNEVRVIRIFPEIAREYADFQPDILAIQDIYALALNTLPPRYTQQFSIVLHEPVDDEQIRDALRKAFEQIMANPVVASDNSGKVCT